MPWTIDQVDEHKKGLDAKGKRQWVAVANAALKKCMDEGGDEESCAASAIRQANGVTGPQSDMENYRLLSTTYEVREELLQGRKHLVIPVVMMKEGVHRGSHGPLLHRADDLGLFPGSWNGIPISIHHPQEDGQNVSANHPHIIDEWVVGKVFNTVMDNGSLKAEAWLDKEHLNRFPEVLEYIVQGRPLDVSVGVFTEDEMTGGEWQGEAYDGIARNHRPDHLALLPGGTGACSWNDGCGVRAYEDLEDNSNPCHGNDGKFCSGGGRSAPAGGQGKEKNKAARNKLIKEEGEPSSIPGHVKVKVFVGNDGNERQVLDSLRPGDRVGSQGKTVLIHYNKSNAEWDHVSSDTFKKYNENPSKIWENKKIKKGYFSQWSIAEIGTVHFRQSPVNTYQGGDDDLNNNVGRLKYDGTESTAWSGPTLADFGMEGKWQDLKTSDRAKVAGHYLIGTSGSESFADLKLPVVNPKTGKLNEHALRACISGRGSAVQGISPREKMAAMKMAYRLLNDEFEAELEVPNTLALVHDLTDQWAKDLTIDGIVLQVNELGHREISTKIQAKLDRMDDDTKVHYLEDCFDDYFIYRVRPKGSHDAPVPTTPDGESLYRRSYRVGQDDTIEFTGEAQPVVKKTEYVTQSKGEEDMANNPCCPEKVLAFIQANAEFLSVEKDTGWLEALTADGLAAVTGMMDKMMAMMKSMKDKMAGMQSNEVKVNTKDVALQVLKEELADPVKVLALLPPETRATLEHGQRLYEQERERKIDHILANTAEGVYTKERLSKMADQDLNDLAAAIKAPVAYDLGGGHTPKVNNDLPKMLPLGVNG